MRAAWMTALLFGVAAVAAACTAGPPDRAVMPSQRPVVLTLANALTDSEQLGTFVREVSALTGGTVRIDVRSHWRPGQVGYESGLIADVRAGKADLGVAGSRAFDSAGVLSMRALGAPLLITSYAAEQAVLASPVTSGLLGALRPAGLIGIGILPGDLFRPDGAIGPLVKPSDYAGRSIGTQQSLVAEETLRALGAHPDRFPVAGRIGGFDGVVQPIRSISGFRYNETARFLTANVALWPRPLVVFGTEKALGKLTAAQRQALRQAAVAALPGSMRAVRGDEQESAQNLCRIRGFSVLTATHADLAALRAAVAPVYARLKQDPATRNAIRAISAVVGGVASEATLSCARYVPSPAGTARLDGVYTMDTKFGDDPADPDVVPENYGHWVFVLRGRHFADTQQYRDACTWGYGTLTVTGARMEWTFADGGGASPTGAQDKPGEFFVFGWSRYRDALTLTPVRGAISPVNFRMKPWHRISATPSLSYLNKTCPPPPNALG
jgi:TRAP-type C4-dicarboxylate transport system substrate-binding protein